MDVFQMSCLRLICHISLQARRTNDSILAVCKIDPVSTLISYRKFRWLGHVARMSHDRLPKQMLFGMLAPAQDRIARPVAGRRTKA